MEARFELISPEGKVWTEGRLFGRVAEVIGGLTPLYGVLVLSRDDGSETVIADDFDIMMQQICLRLAIEINQGLSVEYRLAAHPESVHFAVEGERVRISGDVRDEALYDRHDLATALIHCGERFVAFKEAQLGTVAAAYYRSELEIARTSFAVDAVELPE
jgi:hypothetical protein